MSTKNIPEISESEAERFRSKIAYSITDRCWLWQAAIDGDGYGIFYLNGANFKAHRLAYFMAYGRDPGTLLVAHTCLTKDCVRPGHLYLARKIVTRSKFRKRRSDSTPLDVMQKVKDEIKEGVLSQKQIAVKFNLTQKTVSKIKRGGYATNAD